MLLWILFLCVLFYPKRCVANKKHSDLKHKKIAQAPATEIDLTSLCLHDNLQRNGTYNTTQKIALHWIHMPYSIEIYRRLHRHRKMALSQHIWYHQLCHGQSWPPFINGRWYVNVPYIWPYFLGYIPLHSPYTGLIYGRYLHFRNLKFPLIQWNGWPFPMNTIYLGCISHYAPIISHSISMDIPKCHIFCLAKAAIFRLNLHGFFSPIEARAWQAWHDMITSSGGYPRTYPEMGVSWNGDIYKNPDLGLFHGKTPK